MAQATVSGKFVMRMIEIVVKHRERMLKKMDQSANMVAAALKLTGNVKRAAITYNEIPKIENL